MNKSLWLATVQAAVAYKPGEKHNVTPVYHGDLINAVNIVLISDLIYKFINYLMQNRNWFVANTQISKHASAYEWTKMQYATYIV